MKKFNGQFFTVTTDHIGQRIDNFLCTQFKGVPKSMIYRILRKGLVRVNKKRVKPKYKLVDTDMVRVPLIRIGKHDEPIFSPKLNKSVNIVNSILYEDDYLIVLNKSSGIAVHGGSGLNFGVIECLRTLRSEVNFLELIHRLDRDTSGVLLIAKKRLALRSLHEQLRQHSIRKDYLALVRGEWPSCIKLVQAPLLRNIINGKRMVYTSTNGKWSETHFEVKERFDFSTLVKVSPTTGRTHQIRVHALHSGHPIAFDNRYGDREFDSKLTKTGLSRLFLHASAITFTHPNTGKVLKIKAPLDKNLQQCIFQLRQKND